MQFSIPKPIKSLIFFELSSKNPNISGALDTKA